MNPFEHIYCVGRSDVGRRRKNNEDNFGLFPKLGVWLVADGMGGGDDGEIASAAVVREVEALSARVAEPPRAYAGEDVARAIESTMNRASSWIFNRTREKHLATCGSTVVGFVADSANPGQAIAFHAGDSRLYRLRGHALKQITVDHSAAELIGAKDDSQVNPMFRGMVLRAVGIKPTVEIERTPFDIRKGDFILVCSDGLSRMVDDKRICEILRAHPDISKAARALVDAANAAGGVDNVTVVVAEVGVLPAGAPREPFPFLDDAETGTGLGLSSQAADTAVTHAASDAASDEPVGLVVGDPVEVAPAPKPRPAPAPAPAPKPVARPASKPAPRPAPKSAAPAAPKPPATKPVPKSKPASMSVPKGSWREIMLTVVILALAACAVLVFVSDARPGGPALPRTPPNKPMTVVAAKASSDAVARTVAAVTPAVAAPSPAVAQVATPSAPVAEKRPARAVSAGCKALAHACAKASLDVFAKSLRGRLAEERLLEFSDQLRRAQKSATGVVIRPSDEAADRFLVDFRYVLLAVPEVRKCLTDRPALAKAWDLSAQGTADAETARLAAAQLIAGLPEALP